MNKEIVQQMLDDEQVTTDCWPNWDDELVGRAFAEPYQEEKTGEQHFALHMSVPLSDRCDLCTKERELK